MKKLGHQRLLCVDIPVIIILLFLILSPATEVVASAGVAAATSKVGSSERKEDLPHNFFPHLELDEWRILEAKRMSRVLAPPLPGTVTTLRLQLLDRLQNPRPFPTPPPDAMKAPSHGS